MTSCSGSGGSSDTNLTDAVTSGSSTSGGAASGSTGSATASSGTTGGTGSSGATSGTGSPETTSASTGGGTSGTSSGGDTSSGGSTEGTTTGVATEGSTTEVTGSGTADVTTTDTGTTGGQEPLALWLLAVDEPDATTDALIKISVKDGEVGVTTVICDDLALPPGLPADTAFSSLTFDGQDLYASVSKNASGDTLVKIQPCACTVTESGQFGFTSVNAITGGDNQEMFGLALQEDVILGINPMNAASMVVQPLGANWGASGLGWSDPVDNVLYGINASTDRLHTFSGVDGTDLGSIQLNGNFSAVGLELHRGQGTLYACGVQGQMRSLFAVDVESGDVTLVAPDVVDGPCDNLAAPFGPVACVP